MRHLALAAALSLPLAAHAGQDQAQIAAAVKQAARAIAPANAQISLGPISGAQYMQQCAAPLAVTIGGTAPYEQAEIRCPNPGWTLYATVTVAQSEKVAVAARSIIAGQTIAQGDITLRDEPAALFSGRQAYYGTAQLIGAQAQMSLQPGAVITGDAITTPVMVKAGQIVTVNVQNGAVLISIDAVADETGRIGDTILLTNPSSGRRFSALVTANGVVVQLQP